MRGVGSRPERLHTRHHDRPPDTAYALPKHAARRLVRRERIQRRAVIGQLIRAAHEHDLAKRTRHAGHGGRDLAALGHKQRRPGRRTLAGTGAGALLVQGKDIERLTGTRDQDMRGGRLYEGRSSALCPRDNTKTDDSQKPARCSVDHVQTGSLGSTASRTP